MDSQNRRKPELLAPAGGIEAFRAALANGADAVYLGLERFNARRSADNFTLDSLADACRVAHLHGARVYLTLNVLILPEEMEDALTLVADAWDRGIDAVIVQDLGLLRCLRSSLPDVRIHVSTQMSVHSTGSVRVLAGLGVSRVTLARELSISRIAAMASAGADQGVEVESFVHGAICVCYSGQCLMSSLIGGRSANRGRCAQPCRLPYQLVDESGAALSDVGEHLLSPKDLAGISVLPRLVSSGVSALKIEGRMKSPEYVALVTGVYRTALDRAVASPETYEVREGEWKVLAEAFSRGFTTAYLTGERGNAMMSYRRPNNRGVPVGRIGRLDGRTAFLDLHDELSSADTIEVWTSRGRFTQRAGALVVDGDELVTAPAGSRAAIALEEDATAGDRVFRVRNAALSRAAERTYRERPAGDIPLRVEVSAVLGEALQVIITDAEGRSGRAQGPEVAAARTKDLTADEVVEHVGRLGGTPYRVEAWDLRISPGVGLGFSALHSARRAALEAYEAEVLRPWRRAPRGAVVLPDSVRRGRSSASGGVEIVAAVADMVCASAALDAGASRVLVPTWALPAGEGTRDPRVTPAFSRVMTDAELTAATDASLGYPSACVATLGAFETLSAPGRAIESHWALNACNSYTVAQLADMGAQLVWLSPELTADQIATVARRSGVRLGVGVLGRQELMVTEHCVLMSQGDCDRACATCVRRSVATSLRDRKGYLFPVRTDPTGRTHVYNSVPLDVTASLDTLVQAGVTSLRADLETEGPAAVGRLVRQLRDALGGRADNRRSRGTHPTTTGHLFRGVD